MLPSKINNFVKVTEAITYSRWINDSIINSPAPNQTISQTAIKRPTST